MFGAPLVCPPPPWSYQHVGFVEEGVWPPRLVKSEGRVGRAEAWVKQTKERKDGGDV